MEAGPDEYAAGEFGSWLSAFRASLHDGDPAGVPCDGCTACCRSGKLIPVEPDEADALAHIAADCLVLLKGGPGEPARRVLRHDESGRCSQLTPEGCSVYANRPRACRMYDCRIFPAAGVRADSPLIAERAQRWRFSYASDDSRERHAAVRMAAVALGFPGGLSSPVSPTQHAVDAIEGSDELGGDSATPT